MKRPCDNFKKYIQMKKAIVIGATSGIGKGLLML